MRKPTLRFYLVENPPFGKHWGKEYSAEIDEMEALKKLKWLNEKNPGTYKLYVGKRRRGRVFLKKAEAIPYAEWKRSQTLPKLKSGGVT